MKAYYDSPDLKREMEAQQPGSLIDSTRATNRWATLADCAAYFAALEDDRDDDGDFVGAGR